ncbi:MAG TPA: hypothetical protein VK636_11445, partial [Gemmatimonadaceae bacterium]|nr:hypothetical protein [Gemmatimonadaceae bacterium]
MRFRNRVLWNLAALGGFTFAVACSREGSQSGSANDSKPSALHIALDTSTRENTHSGRVIVTGLSEAERQALRKAAATWTNEEWSSLLRVTTGGADAPPIAGRYAVTAMVEFQPVYAFDPGREYTVRLDPARLPTSRPDSATSVIVSLPPAAAAAPTTVTRVLPTAGVVPENALRFYIEFSAP